LSNELTISGAFAIAFLVTFTATPIAIRLARRTDFYDRPVGYKQHSGATPYLGGAAVILGFAAAAIVLGHGLTTYAAVVACAIALFVLGTVDDRVGLGIVIRLAATVGCAIVLYAAGLGWSVFSLGAANLVLTVLFVVGVVNAYNLMDNLDGATASVATVGAAVAGILALLHTDLALGALAFGLAGACAGFLPYNLGGPAKIFLGDGGSMPIGLVVAATVMTLSPGGHQGLEMIPLAVVLVGLPALDTALVIVSRRRRGVAVLSGGRDHLTHRLLIKLGSPQRVAVLLAAAQGAFCAATIVFFELDAGLAVIGAFCCIALGVALVVALETPGWAPAPATASDESSA
jgi:UDP-GlcNAc:undecaprenyl-phosphate GlcNAc-1-phosphate transferase